MQGSIQMWSNNDFNLNINLKTFSARSYIGYSSITLTFMLVLGHRKICLFMLKGYEFIYFLNTVKALQMLIGMLEKRK